MSEKDQNFTDAGDLRPSNLLTYSGPGSIVNTRYDAIMIYHHNYNSSYITDDLNVEKLWEFPQNLILQ